MIVSDCDTPEPSPKDFLNGNTPQPPSGPTRPNNIRRPIGRVSSEQSLNSNESKRRSHSDENIHCSLALFFHTRSPESSNVSFESGYDSNNIVQPIPPSPSSSNLERKSVLIIENQFQSRLLDKVHSIVLVHHLPVVQSVSLKNVFVKPIQLVNYWISFINSSISHSYVNENFFFFFIIVFVQIPSSSTMNATYRRVIDRYRIFLFSKGSSQNLKSELSKLSNHLSDNIEFDSGIGRQGIGIQSLTNSSRSSSTSSLNLKAGKCTHPSHSSPALTS